jgi:hypothetical protein
MEHGLNFPRSLRRRLTGPSEHGNESKSGIEPAERADKDCSACPDWAGCG